MWAVTKTRHNFRKKEIWNSHIPVEFEAYSGIAIKRKKSIFPSKLSSMHFIQVSIIYMEFSLIMQEFCHSCQWTKQNKPQIPVSIRYTEKNHSPTQDFVNYERLRSLSDFSRKVISIHLLATSCYVSTDAISLLLV